jgi:hypothetical protein
MQMHAVDTHINEDGRESARDVRWLSIWLAGLAIAGIWNLFFLNTPAYRKVLIGFANTMALATMVTACTLVFGWATALAIHLLRSRGMRAAVFAVTFGINILRSIPQVVGALLGYMLITNMLQSGAMSAAPAVFVSMALSISAFVFLEMSDLIMERIAYFQKRDFYNAMVSSGVPEARIVNFDILWKNSRLHIFNKMISVFGMAVFLQCSVDFIISVGLSANVNSIALPTTLGGLLAKIDSKQDILAIGHTLTHPGYIGNLFFSHLQGITAAFLIVFTLLCLHNIAAGFAERHRL